MVVDLDLLREDPFPYLGWYLEGEAEPLTRYCWYANEDRGGAAFRVRVNGRRLRGQGSGPHDAAKTLGLALVRGKIFLGTWTDGQEYSVDAPVQHQQVPTQRIREAILLGLFRLHEGGFPRDIKIDLEGVAAEFGVSPDLVQRAVEYLKDTELIEDYGTFGRNWSTGDFWISTRGIAYLEERRLVAYADPIADNERRAAVTTVPQVTKVSDPARVAVVHGRNEQLRKELFIFLRALGLRPIEWATAIRETGSAAPYVGQVIESLFQNVQAAVVLWTGDDSARLREELRHHPADAETRLQPRPNVILEAGMALSRMPERTILVQIGDVDEISDLAGRHVVRLSDEASRHDLANRLETAGCPVDRSGADWLRVGRFRQRVTRRRNTGTQDQAAPVQTEPARRSSLRETLRGYRDRMSREYDAEPEVKYELLQQVADLIEDALGKDELERFWSDDGLDDRQMDNLGRRHERVLDLLSRIDHVTLSPDWRG